MVRRVEYAVCRTSTAAEMKKDLNIPKFGSTFFPTLFLNSGSKTWYDTFGIKERILECSRPD